MRAQILSKFAGLYPRLDAACWYPVSPRGVDDARPEGATRSAGGPTESTGLWLMVDGDERFVFRQHVQIQPDP